MWSFSCKHLRTDEIQLSRGSIQRPEAKLAKTAWTTQEFWVHRFPPTTAMESAGKLTLFPLHRKTCSIAPHPRILEHRTHTDWRFDRTHIDTSHHVTSPEWNRQQKSEKGGHIQWSEFFGDSSVFCKSKEKWIIVEDFPIQLLQIKHCQITPNFLWSEFYVTLVTLSTYLLNFHSFLFYFISAYKHSFFIFFMYSLSLSRDRQIHTHECVYSERQISAI